MADAHTNGLTVSYRGSGYRRFTNIASSLTDRISGCNSDKEEALGIILFMRDAHSIPFPDLHPQEPSMHAICLTAAASICLASPYLKLLLECCFKLTLAAAP